MNNKNVVHITTVHHPYDTRIYHKQCKSLKSGGYNVTLIAPRLDNVRLDTDIKIVPIKKYKNRILRMIFSTILAFKEAKKIKADFYHIHDPELILVGWLLKKDSNIVIYDVHEDYETSIMQKKYIFKPIKKMIVRLYKLIEKNFGKEFKICLAEKYYKDMYPHGTCILNYPLLNNRLLNRNTRENSDKLMLIYTGNVSVDRGALIHAKLPLLHEKVVVYLYGKCPISLAEKMKENVGTKKNRLIIIGIEQFVPREEIDNAYLSQGWLAGLAIFPPTEHYYKKELTKFFEYMSAGIPIICSNYPVWESFIKKYDCGITVDPFNCNEILEAIKYLSNNKEVARRMGLNGRKAVVEELNWGVEEKKLIQWYKDIGNNKS